MHGSLQDDPEQIELLQEKLEVWLQVGKELEFEDPEDEITKCAKGLSWVASKLLKVARCLPFDTCSPKDAWWAAREGRAVRRIPPVNLAASGHSQLTVAVCVRRPRTARSGDGSRRRRT